MDWLSRFIYRLLYPLFRRELVRNMSNCLRIAHIAGQRCGHIAQYEGVDISTNEEDHGYAAIQVHQARAYARQFISMEF